MRLRRAAGREDRRGGAAVCVEGAGRKPDRSGRDRALPARARGLQGAQGGALPRRAAEVGGRQDPAQGSARARIGGAMTTTILNYRMTTAGEFVGRELGASDWVVVDQERINQF